MTLSARPRSFLVAAWLFAMGSAGCGEDRSVCYRLPVVDTSNFVDLDPAWSPDGKSIAYSHRIGQPYPEYEIRILDVASDTSRSVARGRYPSWSPDGRRIAYSVSRHAEDMDGGVNIIDLRDNTIISLTSGPTHDPSWSPDGALIAYEVATVAIAAGAADHGIWLMNRDGSDQRFLVEGRAPAWSPDGSRIAFVKLAGGSPAEEEVAVFSFEDSSITQLTRNSHADLAPTWSPDGKRISWHSRRGLWSMNSDGSDPRLLDPLGSLSWGLSSSPSFSPEGTLIVYERYNAPNVDVVKLDDPISLWTIRPDGTGARQLTDPGREAYYGCP